jgi:hypothetical protein
MFARNMNLSFIDSLPTECTDIDSFLRDRDFECEKEDGCDSVRWSIYYREFKRDSSNAMIRIVLRFELSSIRDGRGFRMETY